ncbi:thioredoxin family protein [Halovivax gelatinilyticus]|uniref:thioredoxin family protein n=1 Tax=Halovivax gelatinilyticus TaxID=2961597 RepID=UPI0020CA6B28|nr:thioredoxin family protein [Halovivax gelatinilyticus]
MVEMESETELEAGDAPPQFELRGTDGETYTLESFDEYDALLLVFTCNHCPYAKAKFDLLNELTASYDDAAIVGVNPNDAEEYPDDSVERMTELVADGTIQWDAYLRDETQEVAAAYGAVCTPDPFLFAREGDDWSLVYQGRLDDALDPDDEPTRFEIKEALDAVLADEPVDLEWNPSRGCSIKWRDA